MPFDEDGKWTPLPWWRTNIGIWSAVYFSMFFSAGVLVLAHEVAGWPQSLLLIPIGVLWLQTIWVWWKMRGRRGSAGRA